VADLHDIVVRFSGTAGEGVLTAGDLLGALCAQRGYHVRVSLSYDAEMRGDKLSSSQVRIATAPIAGRGDRPRLLAAFNREAVAAHRGDLEPGGLLLYDDKTIDDFGETAQWRAGAPPGGETLAIPFLELALRRAGRPESKNIAVLGAVCALLGLPADAALAAVEARFGAAGRVADGNRAALALGFEAAAASGMALRLAPGDGRERLLLSGNQAVARGAVAAGCTFFAGYPITPASEIMEELARRLPAAGGIVMQMEDEMAAVGAVVGASFGGARAMTATSGPGLSLMCELIDLAAVAEVPVVVVDVQRGGPSTGLPTKPEQSDLLHALHGGHGESPRIVLAPSSVAECYARTIEAFALAEACQTPVLLLSDQLLGQGKETVDALDAPAAPVAGRLQPTADELREYRRYRLTASGVSPVALPGTPGGEHFATGLEHNEHGLPDYTPGTHRAMAGKRARKLALVTGAGYRADLPAGGGPVLVGWGSVAGALHEAAALLREQGIPAGVAVVERPAPFPAGLAGALAGRTVLCVEMNFTGQLASLLRLAGIAAASLPWDGAPPAARGIAAWAASIAAGEGGSR
jgi:2-oxoglutarate ferredoxin oxidoreductase subunit alpha